MNSLQCILQYHLFTSEYWEKKQNNGTKSSLPARQHDEEAFWEQTEKNNSHQDENIVIIYMAHMAGLLNFFIIWGFWGFTTLFETSEEAADLTVKTLKV